MRPVLSSNGSSFIKLKKALAKDFEKSQGANIQTNSLEAREILESIRLEPEENVISLNVKSFCTNVPLKEAIDIAVRKLHEQDKPPSFARKTMKGLFSMAVSQAHFKCNDTWYVQKNGLAMNASLAIILVILWLNKYKTALSEDIPEISMPEKDLNGLCYECKKKITYRSKEVDAV